MIHFFLTGGTIDSVWDSSQDTAVPRKESIIPQFIKSLKPYFKFKCTKICMKDSRKFVQADRKKLLRELEKTNSKQIIITHGTYTMPNTARYLQSNLKRKDQKIILTGSMIPMDGFTGSDGGFNLGFAIARLESIEPGIYIAMNARFFSPAEVVKNLSEGRFSLIPSK